MKTAWRCAVCETVNHGGTVCSACGAALTKVSAVATAARGRVSHPVPAPPPPKPLPPPLQRAVNREPVDDEEWEEYDEGSFKMLPIPGGCLFVSSPRRSYW